MINLALVLEPQIGKEETGQNEKVRASRAWKCAGVDLYADRNQLSLPKSAKFYWHAFVFSFSLLGKL